MLAPPVRPAAERPRKLNGDLPSHRRRNRKRLIAPRIHLPNDKAEADPQQRNVERHDQPGHAGRRCIQLFAGPEGGRVNKVECGFRDQQPNQKRSHAPAIAQRADRSDRQEHADQVTRNNLISGAVGDRETELLG